MATSRRRRPAEVAEAVSQVVTDDPKTEGVRGEFPLPEGHYFYLPSPGRSVHSGQREEDREGVVMIQQQMGVAQTGVYDSPTAEAVGVWRGARGLPRSPLVDADVWAQMAGE